MANKQIGFGIIGAGEIARSCSAVFKDNPKARLIAIADVNQPAAEALGKETGAEKIFSDYRELLSMKNVDAVYIATPPFLHRKMLLDALAADKHIICEKPLMMNSAEMREIVEATDRKKHLKVASCSSRFLGDTAVVTRKLVHETLGKIERMEFIMSRPGPPVAPNWTNWRASLEQSGGGLVMDWGVYDLDWMSFVLGEEFRPRRLVAQLGRMIGKVETTYAVQMYFDGFWIDWQRRSGELGPMKELVEIRGTDAGLDVPMTPSSARATVYRFDAHQKKLVSETIGDPPPDWKPAGVWPIRDLIDAIQEDRQPLSPPRRQMIIHQVIDAVYRSAKEGQVVDVK